MTSGGDQLTILLVLVCLVLGYGIVSLTIGGISKLLGRSRSTAVEVQNDREQESRRILGVAADAGDAEIEAAYRQLLVQYDLDRARKVAEAYEYLQRHK